MLFYFKKFLRTSWPCYLFIWWWITKQTRLLFPHATQPSLPLVPLISLSHSKPSSFISKEQTTFGTIMKQSLNRCTSSWFDSFSELWSISLLLTFKRPVVWTIIWFIWPNSFFLKWLVEGWKWTRTMDRYLSEIFRVCLSMYISKNEVKCTYGIHPSTYKQI